MTKKDFIAKITKPATIFEVGGFKPDDNMLSSWFGKVLVSAQDENWPLSNNEPMIPLCQLNLSDLPFKPTILDDIDFITLFIDPENIPSNDEPNGNGWCLRAYKNNDNLVPLQKPDFHSEVKAFQLKPKFVENDFPCYEDSPVEIPEKYEDEYDELFPNIEGIKIGGWPTLIQGEIFWPDAVDESCTPEFVFQINSIEKAHWQWGDGGVGYFARAKDDWFFSWQCY